MVRTAVGGVEHAARIAVAKAGRRLRVLGPRGIGQVGNMEVDDWNQTLVHEPRAQLRKAFSQGFSPFGRCFDSQITGMDYGASGPCISASIRSAIFWAGSRSCAMVQSAA